MSMPVRRWLPALALLAACALPSRALFAGDGPGSSDRDRAVAAVLEASNLRMRAKIEEAEILDRAGRHDEALATLRAVESIHREGLAFVERWLPPSSIRVGVVRREPSRPPAAAIAPVVRPAEPAQAQLLRSAAGYLLAAQRADGWFRTGATADGKDADPEAVRDVPTTALAVLALVDAAGGDDAAEPRARAVFGVKRGVGALLGAQLESGAFGDGKDLEAHALAAWAVAAGASLVGRGVAPSDARGALEKALAFSLSRRDDRGLWLAGTGSTSDDWILSAWMASSLYELSELPGRPEAGPDVEQELAHVQKSAREVDVGASRGLSAAAQFAHALLAGDLDDPLPDPAADASVDPLPRSSEDETALLLGTTYRYGRGMGFIAWREAALAPERERQHRDGPLAGSWDPVGSRAKAHGRTYATACELLAALLPIVPYRAPRAD